MRKMNGQGLVEYALVLVLIAVVVIVILAILSPTITRTIHNVVNGKPVDSAITVDDVKCTDGVPQIINVDGGGTNSSWVTATYWDKNNNIVTKRLFAGSGIDWSASCNR